MPTPKNKRKFALWLYPETLEKIGQLYTADDCRSKSEFIEKAVQFYIDHLTAEDQRSMLPNAMLSSMKSIVAESDNRISRLLFKIGRGACRHNECGGGKQRHRRYYSRTAQGRMRKRSKKAQRQLYFP